MLPLAVEISKIAESLNSHRGDSGAVVMRLNMRRVPEEPYLVA
jgi:hypothetical protein